MACVFEQHMPQHACKSKLLVVCISSSMTSFFYCNNLIFYPEGSNLIRYLDLILDMQLHEEIFLLLFITNLFCSNKIISNKNTSDLKKKKTQFPCIFIYFLAESTIRVKFMKYFGCIEGLGCPWCHHFYIFFIIFMNLPSYFPYGVHASEP